MVDKDVLLTAFPLLVALSTSVRAPAAPAPIAAAKSARLVDSLSMHPLRAGWAALKRVTGRLVRRVLWIVMSDGNRRPGNDA